MSALGGGEDCEDLLQDLWLRLQHAPHPPEQSLAYLMRAAHNLVIDRARAQKRRMVREQTYHSDGPGPAGDVDETPNQERVALGRERLRRIFAALRALGPRTEHVVRRHRIDGVQQRDLAAELGVSLSTVEKTLQKAYKALAQAGLDGDPEGEGA